jgi:hypothetical protein
MVTWQFSLVKRQTWMNWTPPPPQKSTGKCMFTDTIPILRELQS